MGSTVTVITGAERISAWPRAELNFSRVFKPLQLHRGVIDRSVFLAGSRIFCRARRLD